MANGLLKSWGIGARLVFEAANADKTMERSQRKAKRLRRALSDIAKGGEDAARGLAEMEKSAHADRVQALRGGYDQLRNSVSRFAAGMQQAWMTTIPVGMATIAGLLKSSQLAANLEMSTVSMEVLVGNTRDAVQVLKDLRVEAARTPFEEADLISASKALLTVTKGNVAEMRRLLKMSETMAALGSEEGKTVKDAALAIQDAMSGSGIARLVEFPGLAIRAENLGKDAGLAGGEAWAKAMANEIEVRLAELLRGKDLVGQLSATFGGRSSTLRDNISGLFRNVGEILNERVLGPMLEPLTNAIMELSPVVDAAFGSLADRFASMGEALKPTFDTIRGLWRSLGTEGQTYVVELAMGVGLLSAALLPIGAVLVGVVGGVVGLGTAIFALWPAMTGFAGIVTSIGLPLIASIAIGLAKVGLAVAALGALGGSSWLGVFINGLAAARWQLTGIYTVLKDNVIGAVTGFWGAIQPTVAAIRDGLQPAFRGMLDALAELLGEFDGNITSATGFGDAARYVAAGVGALVSYVLVPAVRVLSSIVTVITAAIKVVAPFVGWVIKLAQAFFGVTDGTLSFGEALRLSVYAGAEAAYRTLRAVGEGVLRVVSQMMIGIASLVDAVPGFGWAADGLRRGAAGVDSAAEDVGGAFKYTIDDFQRKQDEILRARAARSAPEVTVNQGDVQAGDVEVSTTLTLDGREVSRQQGKAAIRDGERGRGPKVKPARMGRVARGSTVGALRPAEAVAGG